MGRLKESIDRLTFGNPRRCVRFVLWRFLDSLVTSVPSVVMVVATWLLVQPIVHPGAALDFVALWACVAVLAAQVLASYATSHKVYVLSCAGTADAVLDARLAMGEKLRRLPLGFYQRHDAGDIDSVLLRDYETVENYGAEVLSQAGMIAAKTTLSAVVLAFFDWRLALATFAVVPCALPFLWKGFNAMAQSSGRLTKASQECSSRTIEYVAGIRTLKAFNLAGTRFDSLRASFEELRKASLGKEEASRPVGVFGRALLKDAPVVLLDEATSSLDPANEVAVQQAIAELVKRKTVMAIAHRLQSVRDADNIVVLDSGRVESQGTHDELLARSPLYAALWAEQQRANGWKIKPEASPRP